jgi:hypothetical protein
MKNLFVFFSICILPLVNNTKETEYEKKDLMKDQLNESIEEFVYDMGVSPDSCYFIR